MSALSGFPLVNQNSEPTMDGHPDENAPNNCVATCLAAILTYLNGKPYDGDQLKDAVYGQSYTGPMDPARFIGYCAGEGVRLSDTTGEPSALVLAAHAYVAQGQPVLLQIPSAWNDEPPPTEGSTHCVVAAKEDPGSLTCMNPWGGFWHYGSDSYWTERVRYGSIWKAEKVMAGVPTGWRDDGTTLYGPNGVPVTLGFRDYVLAHTWDAGNWPLVAAYGAESIEPGNPSIGQGTRQDFRVSSLGWTASRGVYQIWVGQDVQALMAEVASLKAQLAAAQQSAPAPTASDSTEHAKAQALDALMALYGVTSSATAKAA